MKNDNLILGCDPEFTIQDTEGRIVPARQFFQNGREVGLDGNSDLGELRPGTSTNPMELVGKLAVLIDEVFEKLDNEMGEGNYKLLAGPLGASERAQGGHIHIANGYLTKSILENLSYLTNALELTLFDPIKVLQRRKGTYGKLGAFRRKNYGLEFRQPVSWLSSAETSYLFLATTKLIFSNPQLELLSNYYKGLTEKGVLQTMAEGEIPINMDIPKILGNYFQILDETLQKVTESEKFYEEITKENWEGE